MMAFHISPYLTMGFLGILACLATQYFNFTQAGFKRPLIWKIVLLSFLSFLVGLGCAVLGFWQNEGIYRLPFREWFDHVGMTAYHGMIGTSLFFMLGCRVLKLNIPKTCAIAAPSIVIFFAFGRVGCSIAGCCYGVPADFTFLGYQFDRFPTAQLESLFFWLLFLSLEFFIKKYRIVITVMSYSVFRFFNEFFRGDDRGILIPGSGLSPAQTISILLFAVMLAVLIFSSLKHRHDERNTDELTTKGDVRK